MAGKSEQFASLLDHALRFHAAHGHGDCPVCGRPNTLDEEWHQAKAQEAEDREELKRATAAARTQINVDGELLKTAEPLSLGDLADKVQRSLPEPALSAVVLSSPWESR